MSINIVGRNNDNDLAAFTPYKYSNECFSTLFILQIYLKKRKKERRGGGGGGGGGISHCLLFCLFSSVCLGPYSSNTQVYLSKSTVFKQYQIPVC